ncbi:hypothetical protein QE152_g12823 [Popillia japonica]|uniref:Myb/SANT-like domain-containing protein n=1 Tax=Popillia japonica TaxID=7064 RepID=A0AAW1LBU2_POPJA
MEKSNKDLAKLQAFHNKCLIIIPGKRKTGRPRNTWRRTIEDELGQLGTMWNETRSVTSDRTKWRDMVERLCEKLKEQ